MSDSIKLNVPYVSQWDATAHYSRGDCGIVAACMIALWKGIKTTPDAMIKASQLPIGRYSYTFNQVILAAGAVGLKLRYVGGADWAATQAELQAGRPTIMLVRYGDISGNQDDFDGAHFWTIIGCDDSNVFVNDPDWWTPRRDEGGNRVIALTEVEKAMGEDLIPTGNKAYQSLFLVP